MEEKILEIINNHNKALTYEEIMNELEEKDSSALSKSLINLQYYDSKIQRIIF